jgi:hypothetical protein
MGKLKKVTDLDLYILNTKNPNPNEVALIEAAYKLWQTSWEKTFTSQKVNIGGKLFADDFLDRELIALCDGSKPVALFFTGWFHIRDSHLGHSYFKNYPTHVIKKFKELGIKKCMFASYMTCHPDWRKKFTDVPVSELLFSLAVKRFETSEHEYLIGYIRKDNDFQDVFYRHGGIKVAESNVYNSEVDYAYMTAKTRRLSTIPGVADAANELWENMMSREKVRKIAA